MSILAPLQTGRRLAASFHSPVVAKLILALAIALTISAWYFSKSMIDHAAEEQFVLQTDELASAIDNRMTVYEQVLWGGVGLFNTSGSVSREDWATYVDILDIDEHWPGIQGLGYSVPVAADDVSSHTASIRAEGFPDYEIRPQGQRDEYTSIIYLEPFDWRNERAFGFDMWSNDLRREAMTRARDNNVAAMSGVITLVQETDEDVQRGFLTYVPVYNGDMELTSPAERAANLQGWVYAAFRGGDLMHGIINAKPPGMAYEIFDGFQSEERMLFDSNGVFSGSEPSDDIVFSRSVVLDIKGREWIVVFTVDSSFESGGYSYLPNVIAAAGLIIDLLLFYVISALTFMHTRAKSLATEMTAELRKTKEGLEERSKKLEEQSERLRESNAELEQFAYIASHDLQEPLRGVSNYTKLLEVEYSDSFDEQGKRWLNYVASGSERMSELIRELLRYSTIDAEIETFVPISLYQTVASTVEEMSDSIAEVGAAVTVEPLPTVVGNAAQLERLVQNLLTNALKYREPTRPLEVRIFSQFEGDECRITVQDNGIGIRPEYQRRIFEIFKRVGSRDKYPGTGIGLSICRKIVDAHRGTIGVESTFGEGSSFWFTIPIANIDLRSTDHLQASGSDHRRLSRGAL